MTDVRFEVLDVGQGSGNFIEIYDDDENIIGSILIDLGTEYDPFQVAQRRAITYITGVLNLMATPTIDLLILTHSDSDHINLVAKLLSNFSPPGQYDPSKKVLTVSECFFAGEKALFSKYSGKNVLDLIAEYMTDGKKAEPFLKPFSSFKNPAAIAPFRTVHSVDVYILYANVVNELSRAKKESAYYINTRSAVVMLSFKGIQFIVTGDATGLTLLLINRVLGALTPSQRDAYFPTVFMLTAPHHGSAVTTFDIKGVRGKNKPNARQNLIDFASMLKPRTLSLSSGQTDLNHPAWRVIEGFLAAGSIEQNGYDDPDLAPLFTGHIYTAYYDSKQFGAWPTEAGYYSVATQYDIFSTTYCLRDKLYAAAIPPIPTATQTFQKFTAWNKLTSSNLPQSVLWEFQVNNDSTYSVNYLLLPSSGASGLDAVPPDRQTLRQMARAGQLPPQIALNRMQPGLPLPQRPQPGLRPLHRLQQLA